MPLNKLNKKSDVKLWEIITRKIENADYLILNHATNRQQGRKRRRNKSKDKYEQGFNDWNYCIDGSDLDGDVI